MYLFEKDNDNINIYPVGIDFEKAIQYKKEQDYQNW